MLLLVLVSVSEKNLVGQPSICINITRLHSFLFILYFLVINRRINLVILALLPTMNCYIFYSFLLYYCWQRSCGKVMFSQACVKNSVHRGCLPDSPPDQRQTAPPPTRGRPTPRTRGRHPQTRGRHPPGQTPAHNPLGRHPPADGYCSGRYASYWNTFLFEVCDV